jgi:hypothetical protein
MINVSIENSRATINLLLNQITRWLHRLGDAATAPWQLTSRYRGMCLMVQEFSDGHVEAVGGRCSECSLEAECKSAVPNPHVPQAE